MAQHFTGLALSTPRFDPQKEQMQIRFEAAEEGFATLVIFGPDGAWLLSQGEARVHAGSNTLSWQGRDSDGGLVPDGVYTVELFGFDRTRRPVAAVLRAQIEVSNYADTVKRSDMHQRLARFRRSEGAGPPDRQLTRSNSPSVYAVF